MCTCEAFTDIALTDVPADWVVRQDGIVLSPDAGRYTLSAAKLGTVTVQAPPDFGAVDPTVLHLEATVTDSAGTTTDSRVVAIDMPVTIAPVTWWWPVGWRFPPPRTKRPAWWWRRASR